MSMHDKCDVFISYSCNHVPTGRMKEVKTYYKGWLKFLCHRHIYKHKQVYLCQRSPFVF